jgi:glycosyltransferase involved in cell wall biosynthesis
MRRVLLITYHFPPRATIGSVRPMGLAKYLSRYGWQPVVVTPRLPGATRPSEHVVETDYSDVVEQWKVKSGLDPSQGLHQQFGLPRTKIPSRLPLHTRLIKWLRPLLLFPDDTKGWIEIAVDTIAQLKERDTFDAILSTSPPITCNLIAARAKELLGVPWLADFRDLWSQDTSARNSGNNGIFHFFDQRLESRILAKADALVAVSEPWAERLQQRAPRVPVHCIPNGYDPEDFGFLPVPLTKSFSITYAGQLYEGKRNPTPLLEVLSELIASGALVRSDVVVRFYGPPEPWLTVLIQKYGLEGVVEIHGVVGRDEALRREAESQILLLLGWNDPSERGQHTGKLFEYMGCKRPILAVSGAYGVMSQTLEETRAGVHALSTEQLRSVLLDAYGHFRSHGRVPYEGRDSEVQAYTHQEMARRFAQKLDELVGQESLATFSAEQEKGATR